MHTTKKRCIQEDYFKKERKQPYNWKLNSWLLNHLLWIHYHFLCFSDLISVQKSGAKKARVEFTGNKHFGGKAWVHIYFEETEEEEIGTEKL